MSSEKTYLFRVKYLGLSYYFTNNNYNIIVDNIDNDQPYISEGTIFNSINIDILSSFIKDGGVENNKIEILVDAIEPFTLISPIEKTMTIEVFEYHQTPEINNYVIPRFKGTVNEYKKSNQYTLTVSSIKFNLEASIPLIVVSPICPLQTYGNHCKVNKDNHKARIIVLETIEKIVYFNIHRYTIWSDRQTQLDTNNLGLNYTNGYIEQGNRVYSVEEQRTTQYSVTTTGTNVFTINTEDLFVNGQKVLTNNANYIEIVTVATTINTVICTTSTPIGIVNSIIVETLRLKEDIDLTGNFWIYEGDNHSYDHCKFKFGNKKRFDGFIDIPDRNPVTNSVINLNNE